MRKRSRRRVLHDCQCNAIYPIFLREKRIKSIISYIAMEIYSCSRINIGNRTIIFKEGDVRVRLQENKKKKGCSSRD